MAAIHLERSFPNRELIDKEVFGYRDNKLMHGIYIGVNRDLYVLQLKTIDGEYYTDFASEIAKTKEELLGVFITNMQRALNENEPNAII